MSNIGAMMVVVQPLGSEGVAGRYIGLKRSAYTAKEVLGRGI